MALKAVYAFFQMATLVMNGLITGGSAVSQHKPPKHHTFVIHLFDTGIRRKDHNLRPYSFTWRTLWKKI